VRALGVLVGLLVRVWIATWRVRVTEHPALRGAAAEGARILAFFHGTQLAFHVVRRARPTAVLVSHSRDGELQAAALGLLGFRVARGSSSRGGARGLASLLRILRTEAADAAFAVDGPRGPYGRAKPGALLAARRTGALLVPAGCASSRVHVLERAWDRFQIPWPFARVQIVLGAPVDPGSPSAASELEASIEACNRDAGEALRPPRNGLEAVRS
jgi:hypothetical protein